MPSFLLGGDPVALILPDQAQPGGHYFRDLVKPGA